MILDEVEEMYKKDCPIVKEKLSKLTERLLKKNLGTKCYLFMTPYCKEGILCEQKK